MALLEPVAWLVRGPHRAAGARAGLLPSAVPCVRGEELTPTDGANLGRFDLLGPRLLVSRPVVLSTAIRAAPVPLGDLVGGRLKRLAAAVTGVGHSNFIAFRPLAHIHFVARIRANFVILLRFVIGFRFLHRVQRSRQVDVRADNRINRFALPVQLLIFHCCSIAIDAGLHLTC